VHIFRSRDTGVQKLHFSLTAGSVLKLIQKFLKETGLRAQCDYHEICVNWDFSENEQFKQFAKLSRRAETVLRVGGVHEKLSVQKTRSSDIFTEYQNTGITAMYQLSSVLI